MLNFLQDEAYKVAPLLLECILERTIENKIIRVKIVETEAYSQSDAASHSNKGRTPRTDIMFGEAGHLYVYFTYGMHYCCNVVTGKEGEGAAVLIRAVEPLDHIDVLEERRRVSGYAITNGPAKLCQALDITKELNGHVLTETPIRLIAQSPIDKKLITQTTRIGISRAKDVPWRFYIADNPYVSKK